MAGLCGKTVFNFVRNHQTVSPGPALSAFPPAMTGRKFLLLRVLASVWRCQCWILGILTGAS